MRLNFYQLNSGLFLLAHTVYSVRLPGKEIRYPVVSLQSRFVTSLIFPNYPILFDFLPLLTVVAETSLAGHFMEGTIITRLLLNSEGSPHLLILSRYVFDGRRLRVLGTLNPFSSHSSDPVSFIFIESGKKEL